MRLMCLCVSDTRRHVSLPPRAAKTWCPLSPRRRTPTFHTRLRSSIPTIWETQGAAEGQGRTEGRDDSNFILLHKNSCRSVCRGCRATPRQELIQSGTPHWWRGRRDLSFQMVGSPAPCGFTAHLSSTTLHGFLFLGLQNKVFLQIYTVLFKWMH